MSQSEPARNTSDEVLATEFTDAYQKEIRFVGQWNKWMVYDGVSWDFDHKLSVYTRAREHMRNMAFKLHESVFGRMCDELSKDLTGPQRDQAVADARTKAWHKTNGMLSASTIHNVVTLTRYDRRVALGVDQWDIDPWLLNTPGGTIDLKTGQTRKHRANDYIRKVTKTSPDHKMQPTKWLTFLTQIMKGDEGMVRYLQKVFGYCLVGETKEHQMYFAYGTGKNGKGVTLSTIRSLLGGYSMEAAIETFVVNDSFRHPTELADLQGARLVTCGETEEGARWAEARIKLLTGGDPIKARFMRQDFFQYKPQFKLFLAGNHKPRLANVDQAIERRFRLIPFTYTVPEEQRDRDLEEKLQSEWPAILAWAIDGCLAWQSEGLTPPEAVASATRNYLTQEDSVAAWFNECCLPNPEGFTYTKDLFVSWMAWARECGEPVGTKGKLSLHLEDREPILNISRKRRTEGMGFAGVELRTPTEL